MRRKAHGRQLRDSRSWLWLQVFVAGIVIAGVIASAVGVWRVGFEARTEIDRLAVANSESSQWALSQAEVEVLKFRTALVDAYAIDGTAGLDDVRRRFDT